MGNKNIKKINIENSPNSNISKLTESLKKIILTEKEKTPQNEEEKNIKITKKHNKENQDSKLIDTCLSKHFFFSCLEKQARSEIIREMSQCSIQKNKIIFKQGDIGNYYYIISEGSVELTINGEKKKKLKKEKILVNWL